MIATITNAMRLAVRYLFQCTLRITLQEAGTKYSFFVRRIWTIFRRSSIMMTMKKKPQSGENAAEWYILPRSKEKKMNPDSTNTSTTITTTFTNLKLMFLDTAPITWRGEE